MKTVTILFPALMAFAPLAVSAAMPASLSLVETADLRTELPYSSNGAILFDVPGAGTFGISPQFVDAESGTWSTPEVTRKFEPADGKSNPNTGMGLPGPLRVTDESGGKELFTIEGSFLASAFPIAGKGITLRLSSYTSGKPTIAESTGLNWTIVFP